MKDATFGTSSRGHRSNFKIIAGLVKKVDFTRFRQKIVSRNPVVTTSPFFVRAFVPILGLVRIWVYQT